MVTVNPGRASKREEEQDRVEVASGTTHIGICHFEVYHWTYMTGLSTQLKRSHPEVTNLEEILKDETNAVDQYVTAQTAVIIDSRNLKKHKATMELLETAYPFLETFRLPQYSRFLAKHEVSLDELSAEPIPKKLKLNPSPPSKRTARQIERSKQRKEDLKTVRQIRATSGVSAADRLSSVVESLAEAPGLLGDGKQLTTKQRGTDLQGKDPFAERSV